MQNSFPGTPNYPQTPSQALPTGGLPQGNRSSYGSGNNSDTEPGRKDKRAHHTALERKRRDHIKDKFAVLHAEIPGLAVQDKASRSLILTKATEYIQHMTEANDQVLSEVEELKRQNAMFQEQIRQLELQGG